MAKSDKPKRARTSYIIFSMEIRPKIIAEHPEIAKTQKEIMRRVAEKWNSLTEEEKQVYKNKSDEEKKALGAPVKTTKKTTKKQKKEKEESSEDEKSSEEEKSEDDEKSEDYEE